MEEMSCFTYTDSVTVNLSQLINPQIRNYVILFSEQASTVSTISVRVKTVSKRVERKCNSNNKTEKLVGRQTGIKKRNFKSVLLRDNFLTVGFYCTSLVIVTSKNTKPLTTDKTFWWKTETSWTGCKIVGWIFKHMNSPANPCPHAVATSV